MLGGATAVNYSVVGSALNRRQCNAVGGGCQQGVDRRTTPAVYAATVDPHDFCVLDVETAGGIWSAFPRGFELLFAGIRYRGEDTFYAAPRRRPGGDDPHPTPGTPQGGRPDMSGLADFLDGFSGVLVTFNGAAFDLPVLRKSLATALGRELHVAHHYDLLREIESAAGRRISLNDVCNYTFGEQKLPWDHRQNRRVWAQEPQRLIEYNRVDLALTERLYLRVLAGQHLFLGTSTVLLPPPDEGSLRS